MKKFLFLVFAALMSANVFGQAPTQAYLDYMNGLENYVQNDLYGKVAAVLYDVDELPPAGDYINFVKQIKRNRWIFEENAVGLMLRKERCQDFYQYHACTVGRPLHR